MNTGASGLERAVFGAVTVDEIGGWLERHLTGRLGVGVERVLLRAGRIGAVYGLQLRNGMQAVVKVARGSPALEPLAAAIECQRYLSRQQYPCPMPLDGPAMTDGRSRGLLSQRCRQPHCADRHRTQRLVRRQPALCRGSRCGCLRLGQPGR